METSVKEGVKEIRLGIEEFEAILKKTKLITSKEAMHDAHFEPGELVIRIVR